MSSPESTGLRSFANTNGGGSELKPQAAVDHTAVERRPRVDGPPAVDVARWPQQRIPVCLPHVGEVFAVDEQQGAADFAAREHAEEVIGLALLAIRVRVEALLARVVPLDAQVPC